MIIALQALLNNSTEDNVFTVQKIEVKDIEFLELLYDMGHLKDTPAQLVIQLFIVSLHYKQNGHYRES